MNTMFVILSLFSKGGVKTRCFFTNCLYGSRREVVEAANGIHALLMRLNAERLFRDLDFGAPSWRRTAQKLRIVVSGSIKEAGRKGVFWIGHRETMIRLAAILSPVQVRRVGVHGK